MSSFADVAEELYAFGAASFQSRSQNRKLGPVQVEPAIPRPRRKAQPPYVASTYVSIAKTCSDACPFKNNGCFVQHGPTRGPSRRLDEAAKPHTSLSVIREEVRLIDTAYRGSSIPSNGANGPLALRLHVGGDAGSEAGAELLALAAERWRTRGGGAVWTYTHLWREISRDAWGSISVLASVERLEEVELARNRGYAVAIVVDRFESDKAYFLPGSSARIVPCPAETRNKTCVECRLCFDDKRLFESNTIIGFEKHGPGQKLVAEALVTLRRKAEVLR